MFMRLPVSRLTLLDEATCRSVHKQALVILRDKGFRVYSKSMRQKMKTAGAGVDDSREIVRLPEPLVAEAITAAPKAFNIYDLDGRPSRVGPGTIADNIGTYTEAVCWLDFNAPQLRPSTLKDLYRALKVAATLDLVTGTGAIVWPMDVPRERQFSEALLAILTSTRKHLHFGIQNRRHGQLIIDAVTVAAPDLNLRHRPPVVFASSPTSPLTFDSDSAEALMVGLEFGLIPILAPCPMAGGTSQFSLIGTVLQQTAELLFMATAVYALNPGAPFLWGGAGAAMDMKVGNVSYGGSERSLMMLANIDIAGHLGLPCHSPSASLDSCLLDAQYGAEKTWTYLTRILSNGAIGMAVGAVTNGKAASAEAMVIDADFIRCLKRLAAGIEIAHLDKAMKEIMEIDPGGNFMTADATIELLHDENEYFIPSTFNRDGTMARPLMERAHEQVEQLISQWQCPVPEPTISSLKEVLEIV